jgi:hypothetical protein
MSPKRASKGLLVQPRTEPTETPEKRLEWLANAVANFVTTTPANKVYYAAILDAMWPMGHDVPGPHVSEDEIRKLINDLRATRGEEPYVDPFRRLRELQGDEGFTSIVKEGTRYQLVSLEIGPKREPRTKLPEKEWKALKEKYGYRCGHCGRQQPDIKLSPDHRQPRSRGGSSDQGNWQPLCEQCNNLKSSMCQGCEFNCNQCSWAFPEHHKPIAISDENKELLRRNAEKGNFLNPTLSTSFSVIISMTPSACTSFPLYSLM